jgi:hypothetical protein
MTKWKRWALVAVAAVGFGAVVAACGNHSPQATDQNTSSAILRQYQQAQPIPQYSWSQLRASAIDVETAQAKTTQTTSFFFNLGVAKPTYTCPSIGFPIPSTDQITNPSQNNSGTAIEQIEPNGVYTGQSTGTYVVCAGGNGQYYMEYWEGYVQTVTGAAVWNDTTNTVQLTGRSTIHVHVGRNG